MQATVQVQEHVQVIEQVHVQVHVQVQVQVQVLYSVPVADAEVAPVCPWCNPLPAGACSGDCALLSSLACFRGCLVTGCVRAINYQVYRGTPDSVSC